MKNFFSCLVFYALLTSIAFAQSIPPDIQQKIRQIYAEKYPGNFSMQKALINDQFASYKFIQSWKPEQGVPSEVLEKVKNIYKQKYPYNFSMQKVLVQDQVKSYLELNR